MAEITITSKIEDLRKVFDKVKRVFWVATPNMDLSSIATLTAELPVIGDSVNFNPQGDPSITNIKLTTGETWVTYSDAGDADITFQVASLADTITDTFLEKKGSAITMTNTLGGKSYTGQGYGGGIKKVNGALLFASEDKSTLIGLPNVEVYATLRSESGTPAYFNMQVRPLTDTNGVAIAILSATTTTGD